MPKKEPRTGPTLFEIRDEMKELFMLMEEHGHQGPEAEVYFNDWLASIKGDEQRKLNGYGFAVETMEREAKILREEADAMVYQARKREERIKWMKQKLFMYFQDLGITEKIRTGIFSVGIEPVGGKLSVDVPIAWLEDATSAPSEFQKVEVSLSKTAMADFIDSDPETAKTIGLKYKPRGEHLMIRR